MYRNPWNLCEHLACRAVIVEFERLIFFSSCTSRSDARRKKQVRSDVQTGSSPEVADDATTTVGGSNIARTAGRGRHVQQSAGHVALRQHPHQTRDTDTSGFLAYVFTWLLSEPDCGCTRTGKFDFTVVLVNSLSSIGNILINYCLLKKSKVP